MPFAFLTGAATAKETTDTNSVTTTAIDTTGADVIVIAISSTVTVVTPTDSQTNTWTPLTEYSGAGTSGLKMFYCLSPLTSATHTFTETTSAKFPSIAVAAFTGRARTATPVDEQNGSAGLGSATRQPGSVTPDTDGQLCVCSAGFGGTVTGSSINSPFTKLAATNGTGGVAYGAGISYYVQPTIAAVNPTWTATGGAPQTLVASIATFRFALGGGPLIFGGELLKGALIRGGRLVG